jgi:hypothetical protein
MDKVKPNSEPETLDAPSTFGGRRPSIGSALETWAIASAQASIKLSKRYLEGDATPPSLFQVSCLSIGIKPDENGGRKYEARLESDDGAGWQNMILWGGLADDYDPQKAVIKCLRDAINNIGPKPDCLNRHVKSSLRKVIRILQNDKDQATPRGHAATQQNHE